MEALNELVDHLDPEQRVVATNVHGPMAVLAGAGTGKTRAITHRIAYAVRSGAHDPRNILAVTFTARAAGEMRSRLRDLGVGNVRARTFHAAALDQLRHFWPDAIGGFVPEIKENKSPLVAGAAGQLGMGVDRATVRDLAAEIEWAKVSLITPEQYVERAAEQGRTGVGGHTLHEISQLMKVYEGLKAERGVIDFEDVLLILIGIMRDRPDITNQIRHQYRHFIVDEYQDVSPMQHRLLRLWMGDRRDLCVVGDVAQTIYSFTGASARYLVNFAREFPRSAVVTLNRDYRSTAQIVDLANKVVAEDGLDGAVFLKSMVGSGRPVSFDRYADDAAEANEIAGKIMTLRTQGVALSDIAILYRTNAQSAAFETALGQAGIPVSVRGAERFFQRREVKEALVTIRAVAHLPAHGTLPEIVLDALKSTGWRPEPPEGIGAVRERWDAVNTLYTLAVDMWDKRRASLVDFIRELDERSELQNVPTSEAVTLSTLHAAKGLEWRAVFLAGMSEGLMPISLATSPDAVAEERRLFYVGITRAKEELFISYAAKGSSRGERSRSRFLDDHWPQAQSRATQVRHRAKAAAAEFEHAHPDDIVLYDDLKAWRLRVAEESGRKPYVIFHDAVLREIAVRKPRDLAELGRVRGVGTTKLTSFGPEILEIVNKTSIGSGR